MKRLLIFIAVLLPGQLLRANYPQLLDGEKWPEMTQAAHADLKLNPRSLEARYFGAYALFQQGLIHSGLIFLKDLAGSEWKQMNRGEERLAQLIYALGREDAEFVLSRAFDALTPANSEPAKSIVTYLQGQRAFLRRHYDIAERLLSSINPGSAPHADAQFTLGRIATLRRQYARAGVHFQEAASGYSEQDFRRCSLWGDLSKFLSLPSVDDLQSKARLNGARVAYALGDWAQAEKLYRSVEGVSVELAWTLLRSGRPEASKEIFIKLKENPDAYVGKPASLYTLGEYQRVLTALEELRSARAALVNPQKSTASPHEISLREEVERLKRESDRGEVYGFLLRNVNLAYQSFQMRKKVLTETARAHLEKRLKSIESQVAFLESAANWKLLESAEDTANVQREGIASAQRAVALESFVALEKLLAQWEWRSGTSDKNSVALERAYKGLSPLTQSGGALAGDAGAILFSGYVSLRTGHGEAGVQLLKTLVQKFPKYDRVFVAYRLLADTALEDDDASTAEKLYENAILSSDPALRGYAAYRLAWCRYYAGDIGKALEYFEEAIHAANRWEKSSFQTDLIAQAHKESVLLYSESGDPKRAVAQLSRVLGESAVPALLSLANQYNESKEFEKSDLIFRNLLSSSSDSVESLRYRALLLENASRARRQDTVLNILEEIESETGNLLIPEASEEHPSSAVEKALRDILEPEQTALLGKWNTARVSYVTRLGEFYARYFGQRATAEKCVRSHARILYKEKKPTQALTHFRAHWQRFGSTLGQSEGEETLLETIALLEELERKVKWVSGTLPDVAGELIEKTKEYQARYPGARAIRKISYLQCQLHFKYRELEAGVQQCQRVFDFSGTDEYGQKAFNDLRVAYYAEKDWEKTYHWTSKLLLRKLPGMERFQSSLKTIRQESLFLWAEGTIDDLKAAGLYLEIAKTPDMASLHEKALYNAFVRFRKGGSRVEALAAAKMLETVMPKSTLLQKLAPERATLHLEAGDFEGGLPYLLSSLSHPETASTTVLGAPVALQAGLVQEAIGNKTGAMVTFSKFLSAGRTSLPPGWEIAEGALRRLQSARARELSSVPTAWERLTDEKSRFEQNPIPLEGTPQARMQAGAKRLEQLAREYMRISEDGATDPVTSIESYCAIPTLYQIYVQALGDLAESVPGPSRTEIANARPSLETSARTIGEKCIRKGFEQEHAGPFFDAALEKWGWRWDPILNQRARLVQKEIEFMYPLLMPASSAASEEQMVAQHLAFGTTPQSIYDLFKARWDAQKWGLAQLTLSLGGKGATARPEFINAQAIHRALIEGSYQGVARTLEIAAERGLPQAWLNAAVIHLRGSRLQPALRDLKQAVQAKLFDNNPDLKNRIQEFLQ